MSESHTRLPDIDEKGKSEESVPPPPTLTSSSSTSRFDGTMDDTHFEMFGDDDDEIIPLCLPKQTTMMIQTTTMIAWMILMVA